MFGSIIFEVFQGNRATALIWITAIAALCISVASLFIRWPASMDNPSVVPSSVTRGNEPPV